MKNTPPPPKKKKEKKKRKKEKTEKKLLLINRKANQLISEIGYGNVCRFHLSQHCM